MMKASPKRPAGAATRSGDCDELAAKLFKHKDGRRKLRIVLLLAGTVVACAFFRAHDPMGALFRLCTPMPVPCLRPQPPSPACAPNECDPTLP